MSSSPDDLTHLDSAGTARMVDVGDKRDSHRIARAGGQIRMQPETIAAIQAGNLKKGDVIATARIAGIMAAKRTSELIPLCHSIPLTKIDLELTIHADQAMILIESAVSTTGKTGVEMEALTAVSVAALTIYDMAKAIDRGMQIENIRLLEKRGGIHGDYLANDNTP
jgi:cyclic pyranopterin monophosphate synthase